MLHSIALSKFRVSSASASGTVVCYSIVCIQECVFHSQQRSIATHFAHNFTTLSHRKARRWLKLGPVMWHWVRNRNEEVVIFERSGDESDPGSEITATSLSVQEAADVSSPSVF